MGLGLGLGVRVREEGWGRNEKKKSYGECRTGEERGGEKGRKRACEKQKMNRL